MSVCVLIGQVHETTQDEEGQKMARFAAFAALEKHVATASVWWTWCSFKLLSGRPMDGSCRMQSNATAAVAWFKSCINLVLVEVRVLANSLMVLNEKTDSTKHATIRRCAIRHGVLSPYLIQYSHMILPPRWQPLP